MCKSQNVSPNEFALAIEPFIQKIDFSTPKIDNLHENIRNTKGKSFWGQFQRTARTFSHQAQIILFLIPEANSLLQWNNSCDIYFET